MQPNFLSAVKQIASERGLEVNGILEAIKQAIKLGFKKDYPDELGLSLEVEMDPDTGAIEVYADKKVVEQVTSPTTQISLKEAQKIEPKLKEGDHVLVEVTKTGDFGRVAATTARQVILQKLRESERESIFSEMEVRMGSVDMASVSRVDRDGNVYAEVGRAIAKMPPEEQIRTEFYKVPSRVKVLLKQVQEDSKGKILIISRSDPKFLQALFESEVPEIASGTVEIVNIAREAGSRSKLAVKSNVSGVDPIGSFVGQRGARINAVTNELKLGKTEEKIDIIPWDKEIKTYLSNAIRPAEAVEVKIVNADEKQALILIADDSLSLAIGKDGQNVRLAAKLTGWKIDIQGVEAYKTGGSISSFEQDGGTRAPRAVAAASKQDKDADSTWLNDLNLTARATKAIKDAGISNIDQLKELISGDEKIAGLGEKSLQELKVELGI